MKSQRGWIVYKRLDRPKAQFFALISVMWLIACFGAAKLTWGGPADLPRWHHWLCIILPGLEPVFIVLAVIFRCIEKPQIIVERFQTGFVVPSTCTEPNDV